MKKILLVIFKNLLFLGFFLFFPVFIANAESAPTCSASFSPKVVEVEGNAYLEIKATGVIDDLLVGGTGSLQYLTHNDGYPWGRDSAYYKNYITSLNKGTKSDYFIVLDNYVGESSITFTITGPGGSNTCTASFTSVLKLSADNNKIITPVNNKTATFLGLYNGSGLVRSCPSFEYCKIVKYGAICPFTEVLFKDGDWYKVKFTERGVYDETITKPTCDDGSENGHGRLLPELSWSTTEGWMPESVIPPDIRALFVSDGKLLTNYINTETLNGKASGTPIVVGTITQTLSERMSTTVTNIFVSKIFIYFAIAIFLLVVGYHVLRFLKSKQVITINLSKIPIMSWKRIVITVVGLVIVVAVVSTGVSFWQDYKIQQEQGIAIQKELIKILQEQKEQQELDAKQQEIEAGLQSQKLDELNKQLTDFKNKPPEVRIETKTVVVESKDPTVDIIKEWSPRIAYVGCTWAYSDTGTVYRESSGSATLINYTTGIEAVTNKHVLVDEKGNGASDCQVVLPGVKTYSIKNSQNIQDSENLKVGVIEDWGYLSLYSDDILNSITAQNIKLCSDVNVGDKLLVLGYPGIGSQTGITVTEGIVSGYDGNYYITSAKIDHGNSGGAAILIKDSCYLGIPSSSAVGTIESLGRILKASFVIQ